MKTVKFTHPKTWIELERTADMRYLFWLVWAAIGAVTILYLSTLPPFLTENEASILTSQRITDIELFGISVPLHLQGWLTWLVSLNLIDAIKHIEPRIGTALLTFSALALFYVMLRQWLSRIDSTTGLVMLAVSSPVMFSMLSLTNAALAVLLFSLSLFTLTLIHRSTRFGLIMLPLVVVSSLWLGPAGWALAAITLIASGILLNKLRCKLKLQTILGMTLTGLLSLIPIAIMWSQNGTWFSRPEALSIGGIEDNILAGLAYIFIGSRDNLVNMPATWPALSIAGAALTGLGLYIAWNRRRAWRYIACVAFLLPALVELMIYGVTAEFVAMTLFVTTMLSLLAIRYLRDSWQKVFPKNAEALGLSRWFLLVFIGALISFELFRGLVYWPRLTTIQQEYKYTATETGIILK